MLTAGEDLVAILEDLRRTVRSIEAGVASLAGQGLLGLAGGCLLRALTEQGLWPAAWGYAVGAAWACAWLALAYLIGRRDAPVVRSRWRPTVVRSSPRRGSPDAQCGPFTNKKGGDCLQPPPSTTSV